MERRRLWSDLKDLCSIIPSIPWLVIGDFNVISQMEEMSDYYTIMPIPGNVQEFQHCLAATGLTDIYNKDLFFTWSNKRCNGYMGKKLDKMLVNDQWLEKFPNSKAEFLPPAFCNRCACTLKFQEPVATKSGSFKIFAFLTKHKDFIKVVQESWGVYNCCRYSNV